eukprot:9604404-Heterocapsa_arctica.AAC.1
MAVLVRGTRVGSLTNSIIGATVFPPFCSLIHNDFSRFARPPVQLAFYVHIQRWSIGVAFRVTLSILRSTL